MGLFRIALKVAEPITLLAFCAALCFTLFSQTARSKSIPDAPSLLVPEHDRKDALAVLHAGVRSNSSSLKEATPEQLAEFNKNFESRQRTIRFFAILRRLRLYFDLQRCNSAHSSRRTYTCPPEAASAQKY